MKINIVTESSPGWILRRLAESYAEHIPNCIVNTKPDRNFDINFYVNYALFEEKTNIDIGFFTHREKDEKLAAKFDEVSNRLDWCIAMCQKTANLLPKEKTTVIYVAPDKQFIKEKIVFGVVGREYPSNRKRIGWIGELKKIEGVEIIFTNGNYYWEEMPNFYKSIDYLLILSDNEGGPVPLLEALAMGVPVISSDVGFSDYFTTIKYKTLDELKDIICRLIIPKDAWKISSDKLLTVFKEVYESKG